MEKKRKVVVILSVLMFVFGLIWGFSSTITSFPSWDIPSIVFVVLGALAFVVHTMLEVAYKINVELGLKSVLFLFGLMVLGQVFFVHSWFGFIMGLICILVAFVMHFSKK